MTRCDWRVRRRSYGDSFGSCLLMIVLVLGGTMWAYFHFFQNRELVRAGDPGTFLIDKEENRVACIEYQRHMRERLLNNVEAQVGNCNTFLQKTRAGKYKDDKQGFEQKGYEVINDLRDSITELNGRQVPPKFVKGHQNLAEAHKHLYEGVKMIQAAYIEEDAKEAAKLYKQADEKIRKGWGIYSNGRREIKNNYG